MGKLKSFVTGTLIGAGGMYVGLQYHVLMAPEGIVMVPRSPQSRLQDAYADIRTWDGKTWAARPNMSLAVTEYGRADLIAEGATQGVLDKLRGAIAPLQEELGETSRSWEPAETSRVPAPIPESEGTTSTEEGPPARKGFLPLADLFDFGGSDADRDLSRSLPSGNGSQAPIVPAAKSTPPEVEFLPPPDEIDLGTPGQFPDGVRSSSQQSALDRPTPEQRADSSADDEGEWMPLSLLPDDLRIGENLVR